MTLKLVIQEYNKFLFALFAALFQDFQEIFILRKKYDHIFALPCL